MKNELLRSAVRYMSRSVLGMIGLSCYILADTYFVSAAMGADGLAALNIAIPVYSLVNGTGLMIGIGGATRCSLESGRPEEQNAAFTVSLTTGLGLGLIFALIGALGAEGLASLLGADGTIRGMAATYLRTILCFSPFFILNNVGIAFGRNDGAPGRAMAAMLTGSFSNIFLDWLFMFPFGLGMFGAAFATGLAPVIGILVMAGHFRKSRLRLCRCAGWGRRAADMVKLGSPSLVIEASSAVTLIVFNFLILGIAGNTGIAAYGVVANLALVATAVFTGISQGVQPLVSQAGGRGERAQAATLARWTLGISLGAAALIYLAVLPGAGLLASIFNGEGDPLLQEIAVRGLRIYFTGFFPAGLNIAAVSLLAAAGKGRPSFLLSAGRGIVLLVPAALLLSRILGMNGIWLAFPCAELLTLAAAIPFLRREMRG